MQLVLHRSGVSGVRVVALGAGNVDDGLLFDGLGSGSGIEGWRGMRVRRFRGAIVTIGEGMWMGGCDC